MNKKYSVLIVDDERANIIALTDILETEYEVFAVIDSREALETAEEDMPDVILLDILMPGMDGYQVITELKKQEKTKQIPVIFITGLDSVEAEERGLALGAADYISKPFHSPIVRLRVQNQIKIIEQYRIIERLSLYDQLTGLHNRRSFEKHMAAEWKRAQREQTPISLLMIDVDRFKNYNDTYGHQQGDEALVTVATSIAQTLKRPSDFAARFGGEEFIVILPNTSQHGALDVAEQIRSGAEQSVLLREGVETAGITLSIGVATRTHGMAYTIDELIRDSDAALYEAKNKGRNRVCLFNGKARD
jgi:diguanylate cyclase (GGDEF)-like protein